MIAAYQPGAPLGSHVEKIWYCDGHLEGDRTRQVLLPDGRFQLVISLAEGPINALIDSMGEGGGSAPALLIVGDIAARALRGTQAAAIADAVAGAAALERRGRA